MKYTYTPVATIDTKGVITEIRIHPDSIKVSSSERSAGNDRYDTSLAAKLNVPVVLVSNKGAKGNVLQYLNAKTITKAYLLGGNAVINSDIVSN